MADHLALDKATVGCSSLDFPYERRSLKADRVCSGCVGSYARNPTELCSGCVVIYAGNPTWVCSGCVDSYAGNLSEVYSGCIDSYAGNPTEVCSGCIDSYAGNPTEVCSGCVGSYAGNITEVCSGCVGSYAGNITEVCSGCVDSYARNPTGVCSGIKKKHCGRKMTKQVLAEEAINSLYPAASKMNEPKLYSSSECNISQIELSLSCCNLADRDTFSKSDPMIVVYIQEPISTGYKELGRTEVIWNNLNPVFVRKFILDYNFGNISRFKFEVSRKKGDKVSGKLISKQ
ncbi:hypothetical protein LSH36_982g00021 [Paralvinella palmiformis]|uniref:C2 domain-containing protein n=1 Tax=Paralvinella palmiformis TaxID=53620 RepID=A0AAD9MQI3_9ANNE|nr:hypothetical protein LSH36_982g00021 [Paralvinella palmiformis]